MFKVVVAVLVACASAYIAPQMSLANRLSKFVGAAALTVAVAGPMIAHADGATSISKVYRTRVSYGAKILGLEDAAKGAKFDAFDNKKTVAVFDLFIAGTNSRGGVTDKERAAAETKLEADILSAAKAKDASKLKSAYDSFIKVADLKSEYKNGELGQTDSSGYSPTWGTEKQYIYQR
jgi:hypothetical protein